MRGIMKKMPTPTLEKKKEEFEFKQQEGLQIISKSQYRSEIRKFLKEDCFKPDNLHVLHYIASFAVFFAGMYSILNFQLVLPVKLLISIVMGISLASLTFFLHDLQHGSIVKSRILSYPLAISVGIFNFFPPLFWQRVHNLHHARTGDIDDPDRSYIKSEQPKTFVEKFIYRTRISSESIFPIISLFLISTGFFWYFMGTFSGIFKKNLDVTAIDSVKYHRISGLFKGKFLYFVFLELIAIFSFQAFLFFGLASSNILNYLMISIIPVGIAHFTAMSYIHTNHFLSPLTGDVDDPLLNSLSLDDFKISDKVFSNFSYHVEHHLFPAMASKHYPKVRKVLLKLYPDRFQLMPTVEAIKHLFKTPRIYADSTSLTSLSGEKTHCLLPSRK